MQWFGPVFGSDHMTACHHLYLMKKLAGVVPLSSSSTMAENGSALRQRKVILSATPSSVGKASDARLDKHDT